MWFYWIIVPLAWLVWHIAFRIRVIGSLFTRPVCPLGKPIPGTIPHKIRISSAIDRRNLLFTVRQKERPAERTN